MLKIYSENAILAKVRALYGRRLLQEDYDQLLGKKSVGEIAAYLKAETYYAENLAEVKEELIHRGQLENLIRRRTLTIYERLLKYAYHDTLFLRMYLLEQEIEQLLTAIRLLNTGEIGRYIVTLPVYLTRLLSFDLFSLARVQSFDDLLGVLEQSPLYRIVGRFRPSGAHKLVDITSCEAALLSYYYETALEIAEREYSGGAREDLKQLLIFRMTLHNVTVILRMRRYLNADKELILPRIVRVKGVSSRVVDRLAEAPDLHEVRLRMENSPLLRERPIDWDADASHLVHQAMLLRQDRCRKLFRFSTKPAVVVLTYMTLLEIEQSNIIQITEGIRYGVPADQLRQLLCV